MYYLECEPFPQAPPPTPPGYWTKQTSPAAARSGPFSDRKEAERAAREALGTGRFLAVKIVPEKDETNGDVAVQRLENVAREWADDPDAGVRRCGEFLLKMCSVHKRPPEIERCEYLQVVAMSSDAAKAFFDRKDEPVDLGEPLRPERYKPGARVWGFRAPGLVHDVADVAPAAMVDR